MVMELGLLNLLVLINRYADETTFEITADTAIYLDEFTYTISSSDKNEEDVNTWRL